MPVPVYGPAPLTAPKNTDAPPALVRISVPLWITSSKNVVVPAPLVTMRPPAAVLYEGDLVLGGTSSLTLELGGLLLGGQYDHLNVGGTFTEDGALDVVLYSGFAPHFGDTFDLFDAGSISGSFDDVNLPPLPGDLTWDDSRLASSGTLRVVPEPSIRALLMSALVVTATPRRSHDGRRGRRSYALRAPRHLNSQLSQLP